MLNYANHRPNDHDPSHDHCRQVIAVFLSIKIHAQFS